MTRPILIFSLVYLGFIGVLWWSTPQKDPKFIHADRLTRELCVARLNNLSDWVGFGAHFDLEGFGGKTLVMIGGNLCSTNFLKLLPNVAYHDVMSSDFDQAWCSGEDG